MDLRNNVHRIAIKGNGEGQILNSYTIQGSKAQVGLSYELRNKEKKIKKVVHFNLKEGHLPEDLWCTIPKRNPKTFGSCKKRKNSTRS